MVSATSAQHLPINNNNNNNNNCNIPPSRNNSFGQKLSRNNSESHFIPLMDERKISVHADLQKTKEGLANPFACDELSAEDLIYNLFKIPNKTDASIGKLLMVLKNYGLDESDPRLRPMMQKIRDIEREKEDTRGEAKDPRHWKLSREDFKLCISESLSLISQTLQNDLIVPSWGEFARIIKEIYLKCKMETNVGKVADYIPQLGRMSPDLWGVSLCTVDGQRVSFGDSKTPFCVQSVSKAFNYAIAASELGAEYVHHYVGQEPSGRLFNEICLDANQKPHNPMVNSGAIIVTSLIQKNLNMADRFDHVLTQYKKISGGEYVGFNNAVFLSERSTADRNFALAYYMKENGCFPPETNSLTEALDFYFQLCSLEVTCESAAVMAATLANGGVCPITGERCIGSRPCRDVLSLMNSCGMYDYSGQFAFHVGLPAKSGVSGIMIVVVPNLLGLALWSPPLDKLGNSCRGVSFCKEMVQRFNFHNYDSLAHNESQKFDPRRRVGEREKDQIISLLFASKAGDLNTVRRMFLQGYDLEMADYDKRTALHLAASEGHSEVVQFLLLTAKVRPDPKDRWNRTPLHDAKNQNHIGCIQLLEKALSIVEGEDGEEEDSALISNAPDQLPNDVFLSPNSKRGNKNDLEEKDKNGNHSITNALEFSNGNRIQHSGQLGQKLSVEASTSSINNCSMENCIGQNNTNQQQHSKKFFSNDDLVKNSNDNNLLPPDNNQPLIVRKQHFSTNSANFKSKIPTHRQQLQQQWPTLLWSRPIGRTQSLTHFVTPSRSTFRTPTNSSLMIEILGKNVSRNGQTLSNDTSDDCSTQSSSSSSSSASDEEVDPLREAIIKQRREYDWDTLKHYDDSAYNSKGSLVPHLGNQSSNPHQILPLTNGRSIKSYTNGLI